MARVESLWTERETRTLRRLWPNRKLLQAKLNRTGAAIRARARYLGLVEPDARRWTTAELDALFQLWRAGAGKQELMEAIPNRTWPQIKWTAKGYCLGARTTVHTKGRPLRKQVTATARSVGISNRQLDRLARTGTFFYRGHPGEGLHHVLAGADALGIPISITWVPLD